MRFFRRTDRIGPVRREHWEKLAEVRAAGYDLFCLLMLGSRPNHQGIQTDPDVRNALDRFLAVSRSARVTMEPLWKHYQTDPLARVFLSELHAALMCGHDDYMALTFRPIKTDYTRDEKLALIRASLPTPKDDAIKYGTSLTKARVKRLHDGPRRRHIGEGMRRAIVERDGHGCARCKSVENLHVDHIVPISRGGGNELENLRFLCRSCNLRKGSKLDYELGWSLW